MINLCVAGATGRMGGTLIKEASKNNFEIVGAVTSSQNPNIGKTLRELNITNSSTKLVGPSQIKQALEEADVYVSFTTPEAELENIPITADLGTKIVVGTTGFQNNQLKELKNIVSTKVPALFAPNFSIGVYVLLKLLQPLKILPESFDFSIIEAHHSGKKDAPSGTAKLIRETISEIRGKNRSGYGKSGFNPRDKNETEVFSIRAGGISGTHQIICAGPHEMIKIEHNSFSRNVFAQGALLVAEWINKKSKAGIYTLDDIFKNTI